MANPTYDPRFDLNDPPDGVIDIVDYSILYNLIKNGQRPASDAEEFKKHYGAVKPKGIGSGMLASIAIAGAFFGAVIYAGKKGK
jgi:hypothetical protein